MWIEARDAELSFERGGGVATAVEGKYDVVHVTKYTKMAESPAIYMGILLQRCATRELTQTRGIEHPRNTNAEPGIQ
jgi:hypothetical protein